MSARSRRSVLLAALGSFAVLAVAAIPGAGAANAPVGLGSATSFAVLASSTVTNTGASSVNGDLGLSPGSAVVGFPPGTVTAGIVHAVDAAAALAMLDVTTAYDDASSRATSELISADLADWTLINGANPCNVF